MRVHASLADVFTDASAIAGIKSDLSQVSLQGSDLCALVAAVESIPTGFLVGVSTSPEVTALEYCIGAAGWLQRAGISTAPMDRLEVSQQFIQMPIGDAWITDLYATHLWDYFQGPRNFSAHLIGSQRPLKRLTDEIDNLSRYVDQQSQEKLATIKSLVVDKDQLDFARVYLGLTRAWLFVHVPVTYALVVLTLLHILVVYAFSSGAW